MIIDQKLLDDLSARAKANPRLRQSYDLRTEATEACPEHSRRDGSQRMLNALEPGTELPIHRHRLSSETMVVIRGSVTELFYNDEGTLTDVITVAPKSDCSMIQIEKGQWHSLKCNEPDTIIFEAKDRAYEPLTEEDILTFTK